MDRWGKNFTREKAPIIEIKASRRLTGAIAQWYLPPEICDEPEEGYHVCGRPMQYVYDLVALRMNTANGSLIVILTGAGSISRRHHS